MSLDFSSLNRNPIFPRTRKPPSAVSSSRVAPSAIARPIDRRKGSSLPPVSPHFCRRYLACSLSPSPTSEGRIKTREAAMNRLTGSGKSGNPPRSAPSSAPFSSFSNLSPLAPPFTVDRSLPSVTNPSSLPPLPPAGAAPSKSSYSRSNTTSTTVPYFVPAGDSAWPPSSAAATAASSRSGNITSVFGAVDAAPYYPCYSPILDSVDISLGQLPDYKGYLGGRSAPFDVERGIPPKGSVENSSWMDPSQSSQMLLPSRKGKLSARSGGLTASQDKLRQGAEGLCGKGALQQVENAIEGKRTTNRKAQRPSELENRRTTASRTGVKSRRSIAAI
ncbi:hypothetical protein KSP40_PGU005115 [Platanthera guangdongensis]|uniref:Uncharacterized protein n=1 Tax=Platanthera guangdongensis TaxID=2320717 RepID=A0ABR2MHD2_9ASPA